MTAVADKAKTNDKPERSKDQAKDESAEAAAPEYISDQLAVKFWSVVARFYHEGDGIVSLHKAWDSNRKNFVLFPSHKGQDPGQLKPYVWMTWRHELKAPLAGHAFIRDYAEVVETFSLSSEGSLAVIESEHPLFAPEAERRFRSGEAGLVAVVMRVYHLPRGYKFYNVAEKEGDGELVPLPFDVAIEDLTPVIPDADFERRLNNVKAALS